MYVLYMTACVHTLYITSLLCICYTLLYMHSILILCSIRILYILCVHTLFICIYVYSILIMLHTHYSQGIQRVIQEHSRDILQADVYVDLSDKSAETAAALNIASLQ